MVCGGRSHPYSGCKIKLMIGKRRARSGQRTTERASQARILAIGSTWRNQTYRGARPTNAGYSCSCRYRLSVIGRIPNRNRKPSFPYDRHPPKRKPDFPFGVEKADITYRVGLFFLTSLICAIFMQSSSRVDQIVKCKRTIWVNKRETWETLSTLEFVVAQKHKLVVSVSGVNDHCLS